MTAAATPISSKYSKWSFDLATDKKPSRTKNGYAAPPGMAQVRANEGMDGMNAKGSSKGMSEALVSKKKSQAMGLAMSPGKQMAMNAFMLWMSGKNLNMFSISITSTAIMSPIMAIVGMGKSFEQFQDPTQKIDLQMPKLIFIGLNLVWLCIGLYKMSNMRLLPTTSADWVGYIVWKDIKESSSVPIL